MQSTAGQGRYLAWPWATLVTQPGPALLHFALLPPFLAGMAEVAGATSVPICKKIALQSIGDALTDLEAKCDP